MWILGVEQIKTVPYIPLSHPFVDRLIGTIRPEYLDRIFFWNAHDLERKLMEFRQYYNRTVFTEGWKAQYPIRGRRTRIKTLLAWTITDGISVVAACTTYPSPFDYEFATHRLPNNTDGVFEPYNPRRSEKGY